jgi:glycosyltransferase involved in cell wall biosynthesis
MSAPVRILYSFPHAVGAAGIGTTAYHQVRGAVEHGVDVTLYCTSLERDIAGLARVVQTLSAAGRRIPHRAIGVERAYRYHDRIVARALRRSSSPFDAVHAWPAASIETMRSAGAGGVPSLREVPNTHTAHAFEAVDREVRSLGMSAVPGHSHTYAPDVLAREEAEYAAADVLLVPSDYSKRTFLARGVPESKLVLHRYGYDPERFHPPAADAPPDPGGLRAVFVGGCEPRKGLHYALRAWLASGAAERGRFVVCGGFVPGYREALGSLLDHPSVEVRGFEPDPGALMRASDILLFPTVEEGSALVTYEAQASGAALVVSVAAGARCRHEEEGLLHEPGDLETLTDHLRLLDADPALVARLRRGALDNARSLTWSEAGRELAGIYERMSAPAERAFRAS